MNREEAKEILSAYRPGGEDALDPVFTEALELARLDPELAEWFAREQELDTRMSGAVRAVPPPRDFQASLLAAQKITSFPAPRSRWRASTWLAAVAACVALALAALFLTRGNRIPASVFIAEMAPMVDLHRHALDSTPAHAGEVRRWFASRGAPSDFTLPRGLLDAPGMGCEVVEVNGAKVSLLCFSDGRGGVAHLYVVDRSHLSGAPPATAPPSFHMEGPIAVAVWSDVRHTYLLAGRGGIESLRAIL